MRKRRLKLIMLGIIATLTVSMFAGCSSENKDTSTNSKELNIAVFDGGHGKEYWKEVAKRFEKENKGVKVNIEANSKIGDLVRPKIASGDSPDFIYLGTTDKSGLATSLIKDNALEDLTDVFNEKDLDGNGKLKDKILPGFLKNPATAPYGDGKVYLAPLYYNTVGLWYNKEYFNKKGLTPPKTWDEFFVLNKKAKEDGKALFTYQGIYPTYNEGIIFPAIAAAGGEKALDDVFNYKEGAWKSDAVKKVFNIYKKLADENALLKGTVAMSHTQAQTEFLRGKSLFIPNGNWFEGEMKNAIPKSGFSFGFIPAPVFKAGDQQYAGAMIEQMYIPKKAKNKDLAKKFLKFQYKDENVKLNSEKSNAVVPIKNGVELAKKYIPKSNYECFKVFKEGVKPVITAGFKMVPNSKFDMYKETFDPISSVLNKKISVEEWMNRLEKKSSEVRKQIKK